jgi:hypothetical protein
LGNSKKFLDSTLVWATQKIFGLDFGLQQLQKYFLQTTHLAQKTCFF